MTSRQKFECVLHSNICGIIDFQGSVESRLSPCGKGLLRHEDIWPMKSAGKWRWNNTSSIHCFCDDLSIEEGESVRFHLTKKYGMLWLKNGRHDTKHLMKMAELNLFF